MEKDFQTSFIPKQNVVAERPVARSSFGILTLLGILVLITVLLATGGIFFYKGVTERSIESMKNELNLAKNRFEPSRIVELETLDRRLSSAKEILNNHVALSPIFNELGKITMKNIRFTKFSYKFGGEEGRNIVVSLAGEGIGYRSVALQSDLFSQNKYFIDPIFSNLTLDAKGNVVFDLEFMVEPTFLDYQEMLKVKES